MEEKKMDSVENELGQKMIDAMDSELSVLRNLLSVAAKNEDVDSAIKISATIARIIRDAHSAQYQLDQLVSAMISLGAKTAVDKFTSDIEDQKKKVREQKPVIEGDLSSLGPMALRTLANMAGLSQKLGGDPKPVPHHPENDEEQTE